MRSEGPVTAVVGLKDVIVVNTGDAVIVAAKSHAQDIRRIAEAVRDRKSAESVPDPVAVAKEIADVVQATKAEEDSKEAAA